MPGVGQALDVVEQGVPHPGHRALAGPGQVHPGGIIGKPGNGRKGHGHQSAERDVLPQGFAAAHGVDPIYQEPGQVKGVVVDHRIHGDPDHLGGHVVCHHRQDHHQKRQDEFSPEPFGKGKNRRMFIFGICCLPIIHLIGAKPRTKNSLGAGFWGKTKKGGKPSKACRPSQAQNAGEGPGLVSKFTRKAQKRFRHGHASRRRALCNDGYYHSTTAARGSQPGFPRKLGKSFEKCLQFTPCNSEKLGL